jgi:hypothetical protein
MRGNQVPPRFDAVDALLALWVAIFAYLSMPPERLGWFPPAHAFFLLYALLLLRGIFVREAARELQFLIATSLAIASGSVMAFTPMNSILLKNIGIAGFFLSASFWTKEFISRAFGLSGSALVEVPDLRGLALVPGITAVGIAMIGMGIFTFWGDSRAPLVVLSLWLIPFSLNWVCLRRLPLVRALSYLQDPQLWRRTFGGPKTILTTVVIISFAGFILSIAPPLPPPPPPAGTQGLSLVGYVLSLARQNLLAWSIITLLLVCQALVIIQIVRWASHADKMPA